jgi:hypothetical protein
MTETNLAQGAIGAGISKILQNSDVVVRISNQQLSNLRDRIDELEDAIKKHRLKTRIDRCTCNDEELWMVLNDGDSNYPHETTLPCDKFMEGCLEYWRSRQK